jgi:PIN domain
VSDCTVLLDANVLYPAPMRDIFLQLVVMGLFRAKWTKDIHREWIEALLCNEPHRDRKVLVRTRSLMDQSIRDCLVTGYEALIPQIALPDPDDRHVLAAAIVGRCGIVVTRNLRHFPASALAPYAIEVQHPDAFLSNHLDLAPGVFCGAVRKVRARLTNPPFPVDDYLANLQRVGLVAVASELKQFSVLI